VPVGDGSAANTRAALVGFQSRGVAILAVVIAYANGRAQERPGADRLPAPAAERCGLYARVAKARRRP